MAVEHQDVFKPSTNQTVHQIIDDAEKVPGLGKRARMLHVVFADASHDALCDHNPRAKGFGNLFCDDVDTAPVMLHCHVLQVLLHGDKEDAPLELAGFHGLTKFSSGPFSETNIE